MRCYISFDPIAVISIEGVAEHLLDRVVTVDDRHVVDDLFIAEPDKVGDAIADRLTTRAFGCGQSAQDRGAIPIHQHGLCHEAAAGQQSRAVPSEQLHHQVLAYTATTEGKNVDRPADGPHHVVVEKARERIQVTDGQGMVKRLDNGAGDCTAQWTLHGTVKPRSVEIPLPVLEIEVVPDPAPNEGQ